MSYEPDTKKIFTLKGETNLDYPQQMTCKYELSIEDKLDMLLSYDHFEVGTAFP